MFRKNNETASVAKPTYVQPTAAHTQVSKPVAQPPPRIFDVPEGIRSNQPATAPARPAGREAPPQLQREEPETVLGAEVVIKGFVSFKRYLRIDGCFEGEIESEGKLVIGPTGKVKADLDLDEVISEGEIEGNITAKRVELRGEAKATGNIMTSLLSIDEGVQINGQVKVLPDPAC